MSTTPAAAEPRHPLTSLLHSLAVAATTALIGFAVAWGTLGADVRHLERRADASDAKVARVESDQALAAAQSARLDARLDGMERELARLARAVEHLIDARTATARDVP